MSDQSLLSLVIPLHEEPADLAGLHATYTRALAGLGRELQFVYVIDGPLEGAIATLKALRAEGAPIDIISHAQSFGHASALSSGFRHARGDLVMTLPAEPQVTGDLGKLFAGLDDADLVIARRTPPDGRAPGGQRRFEYAARLLFGGAFTDLRSPVRLMRRQVAEELNLYGNQHNFLPLIAQAHGFVTREVEVHADRGNRRPPRRPKLDLFLDLLTAYFLLRFIRKPFRFFGGFGFGVLAIGGVITLWLIFARLFLGEPLVDRPALILSSLMVVMGIQIISVGLIGEIITFSYTREHKDYRIDRIVD